MQILVMHTLLELLHRPAQFYPYKLIQKTHNVIHNLNSHSLSTRTLDYSYHRMNVIFTGRGCWPTRFAATMTPTTPSSGTPASMGLSLIFHTQSPRPHRFVDLVLESIDVMPTRWRFGISESVSPREPAGNVTLYSLSCFLTSYFCRGRGEGGRKERGRVGGA